MNETWVTVCVWGFPISVVVCLGLFWLCWYYKYLVRGWEATADKLQSTIERYNEDYREARRRNAIHEADLLDEAETLDKEGRP